MATRVTDGARRERHEIREFGKKIQCPNLNSYLVNNRIFARRILRFLPGDFLSPPYKKFDSPKVISIHTILRRRTDSQVDCGDLSYLQY